MAAFVPKGTGYLRYQRDYGLRIAGAESNLAIGACKLGHSASWVSRLGDDELGHFVNNSIRAEGVDTQYVSFDERRPTGIMLKQILPGKETSVFYYRERSAAACMKKDMLKQEMFAGGRVLHLTGITPVLSDTCEELILHAAAMGKKEGLLLSFDPNIRRKLWKEKDYTKTLRKIIEHTNILMLGLDEAETLYGTEKKDKIAAAFFQKEDARYIAVKDGDRGAYVADRNGGYDISPYPCAPIDPIGAGDAFNAGFLCGLLEGADVREAGELAAVAGALATETCGDIEGYPTRRTIGHILDRKNGKNAEIYR